MWLYQGEEFKEDQAEGYVGFVYLIENIFTKKKYIGKNKVIYIGKIQKGFYL